MGRRREEALPVRNLDDVGIADLAVRVPGYDLEEVAVGSDRLRRNETKLRSGHFLLHDREVSSIDLDVELGRVLIVLVTHGSSPSWYHDTMTPRFLQTAVAHGMLATMKPAKAMTIRLSADQAELLDTVATVDNQPVSEVIRAAIAEHIERRRRDERFQDGLKSRIARAQQLLPSGKKK
jgi:predicted transcriptional regulator